MEIATFAAGCFWGVEHKFRQVSGVVNTKVGYVGGHKIMPTYEEVCRGDTGHAEAVQISYDPETITYEKLLDQFFLIHNPTEYNKQGPDIGTQYRSVIFYHDEKQRKVAISLLKQWDDSGEYNDKIVTEIVPAGKFFEAEEYHQQFLEKNKESFCPTMLIK